MSLQHARSKPIAEAEVLQLHEEEESDVRDPTLIELFLDVDGFYRWYEEEADCEVCGASLLNAIENAEMVWRGFQLVEVRGQQMGVEAEIRNSYAVDELEEADQDPES